MRLPLMFSALAVSSLPAAPSGPRHSREEKIQVMGTVTFGAARTYSKHGFVPQRQGSITFVMR
jgi:hypothetical protein